MAVTLILSIGLDPDLMVTRSLVLQSAGYLVVTAFSIKEAVCRFQEGDFDLILLCHSIPTTDRNRLTAWIRASGSRIPIVSAPRRLYQDDVFVGVTVENDPAALLRVIEEAQTNGSIPPARRIMSPHERQATAPPPKKPPIPSASNPEQVEVPAGRLMPLSRTG